LFIRHRRCSSSLFALQNNSFHIHLCHDWFVFPFSYSTDHGFDRTSTIWPDDAAPTKTITAHSEEEERGAVDADAG
jgi:hypothetical protein